MQTKQVKLKICGLCWLDWAHAVYAGYAGVMQTTRLCRLPPFMTASPQKSSKSEAHQEQIKAPKHNSPAHPISAHNSWLALLCSLLTHCRRQTHYFTADTAADTARLPAVSLWMTDTLLPGCWLPLLGRLF